MPTANRFGSNDGALTSVRISPFHGSSAAPPGEQLGGERLQLEIDAQIQVVAGRRVFIGRQGLLQVARFRRDAPAACVGHDVAKTGVTVQPGFVAVLDAGLAGLRRTRIA